MLRKIYGLKLDIEVNSCGGSITSRGINPDSVCVCVSVCSYICSSCKINLSCHYAVILGTTVQ